MKKMESYISIIGLRIFQLWQIYLLVCSFSTIFIIQIFKNLLNWCHQDEIIDSTRSFITTIRFNLNASSKPFTPHSSGFILINRNVVVNPCFVQICTLTWTINYRWIYAVMLSNPFAICYGHNLIVWWNVLVVYSCCLFLLISYFYASWM